MTAMARKAERKLQAQMAEARPLPATSATTMSRLPSGSSSEVEVVAAHLVAGDGAKGQRVAGDGGQLLGQKRALDVAGGVQILLDAGELDVALVVAGVFKGDGGLEGEALDEVGLVDGEFAAVGWGDEQLGHALAVAAVQGPGE